MLGPEEYEVDRGGSGGGGGPAPPRAPPEGAKGVSAITMVVFLASSLGRFGGLTRAGAVPRREETPPFELGIFFFWFLFSVSCSSLS
jgi:hypothetical protein